MASTDNQCNVKTDAQTLPNVNAMADYLTAMGVEACSTNATLDQTNGSMHMGGGLPFMQVNADASFSTTKSTTSTVGCEQIVAQSQAYNDTVNNVSCQLKKISANSTSNVIANQKLEVGKGAEINCLGFDFSQNQTVTMNTIASLSVEEQSVIANTVKKGLDQVASAAQSSIQGFGATPQGSKALSDNQTNINNNSIDQDIKDNVSNAISSIVSTQEGKFYGKINSPAAPCKFNQTQVFTVISKSIIENSFKKAFSNEAINDIKQAATVKQEAVNAGAPTAAPPINYAASYSGMNMIIAIGGIFAIVIFGIIVIKMMGQNTKQQNTIDQHAENFKNDDTSGGRGRYRNKIKSNKIKLKKYR
jgi:hypothetical protein